MTAPALARFGAALTEAGFPVDGTHKLALAVSGGPDSLALLALAVDALPGRVTALTVDHHLRPESADEARMVAALCADIAVPHVTLHWTAGKPHRAVQAAARAARYALMADWCAAEGIGWLATAHHCDDQAETLLMRLMRGSGLSGLSGIRRSRSLSADVRLIRPLLDWRRRELAALVAARGWVAVDDPSNRDPRYARTAARTHLASWSDSEVAGLATCAHHLAAAEDALAWTAARAWEGRARMDGHAVHLDAAGLPVELQRRLLLRALAQLAPDAAPKGQEVTYALAALAAGRRVTLAGVVMTGGPVWHLCHAPPRRRASSRPVGKNDATGCD